MVWDPGLRCMDINMSLIRPDIHLKKQATHRISIVLKFILPNRSTRDLAGTKPGLRKHKGGQKPR